MSETDEEFGAWMQSVAEECAGILGVQNIGTIFGAMEEAVERALARRGVTHDAGAVDEDKMCLFLEHTEGLFACSEDYDFEAWQAIKHAALSARVRDDGVEMMRAEREAIANEARRYAANYPQGSDGRNTFVMLAEWIERRTAAPEQGADDGWRPIESAPKDGTAVLLMDGDTDLPSVARWVGNCWRVCWDNEIYNVEDMRGAGSFWAPCPGRPFPSPPTPVSK